MRVRAETITSDRTFTALYDTDGKPSGGDGGGTGGAGNSTCTTACTLPPGGAGTVTVNSQLLDGTPVSGYQVQLRVGGEILETKFTPAKFQLQPRTEDKIVMYWAGDTFFRNYSDGVLTRYHSVTSSGVGQVLTAVYEKIPAEKEVTLNIPAKTPSGKHTGGVTGSDTNGTLRAEPGVWMEIAPAGGAPFSGAFSGSISLPFTLVKGQSYTVTMYSFSPYEFSNWLNGNTEVTRTFTMTKNLEATAIYNEVAAASAMAWLSSESTSIVPEWYNVDG